MINLLPPDIKESIYYARRNAVLRRWLIAIVVALFGALVIIGFGQLSLRQTKQSIEHSNDRTRTSLTSQNIDEVQREVQDISNSLNLTVKVLSRQVLFSRLIKQVGSVIPPGTVLNGLTINQVDGGIDLSALATDYNTATQIQVNLQDPANGIFERADINSVSCSGDDTEYPCEISIRALFGENSQFLLIQPENQGGNDD
jgi:Tfp pilus assembly protein PilN